MKPCIGVMCYQGGSELHILALRQLEIQHKKVRLASDITDDLTALILPGGESSAQYKYCMEHDLEVAIKNFASSGRVILGTCAGLILLSSYKSKLVNGFGLLDVQLERNFYGRQNVSGSKLSDNGKIISFIRAPGIIETGKAVYVIDKYEGNPVLISQSMGGNLKHNIYGATFHPELPYQDDDKKKYNYYIDILIN